VRQKYVIKQDRRRRHLIIREYAVIDKYMRMVASDDLREDHFAKLCEETYDSGMIEKSIGEGTESLIAALRTPNLYPIEPYAARIAESVRYLYDSRSKSKVELFFDDMDLVSQVPLE